MSHRDDSTEHRCGSVALLGWTNVGKSTLLNRLVGDKIAAVADAAQTTRNRIVGVLHRTGRGQICFVDTPGLHSPRHAMNRGMVEAARQTIQSVDVAALIVDAARGYGQGDRQAAELLRGISVPRALVLNKVDLIQPKSRLLPMMQVGAEQWGFEEVLPISARSGEGCDALVECLLRLLPEGPPLYPEDFLTDQSERSIAAEMIREKLLQLTRQELPHATAVLIESWREREDGLVRIDATVLVERDSQKQIVIGRAGERIKRAGTEARLELERFLGRKVYLELWVKVRRDWRDDERTLRELGLGS